MLAVKLWRIEFKLTLSLQHVLGQLRYIQCKLGNYPNNPHRLLYATREPRSNINSS